MKSAAASCFRTALDALDVRVAPLEPGVLALKGVAADLAFLLARDDEALPGEVIHSGTQVAVARSELAALGGGPCRPCARAVSPSRTTLPARRRPRLGELSAFRRLRRSLRARRAEGAIPFVTRAAFDQVRLPGNCSIQPAR